jgi:hypothetical protein
MFYLACKDATYKQIAGLHLSREFRENNDK